MIQTRVVRDEIEHQFQSTFPQAIAQASQSCVCTKEFMHRVAGDRESGAGDVCFPQVRQRLLELVSPFGVAA